MTTVYKFQPETGFDAPERCHIVELYNTRSLFQYEMSLKSQHISTKK